MALGSYRKKRDFKKTSEPAGKKKSSSSKNLYVIQKHAASHLHYDFRLELDGVLVSWAVPKGPSLDPSVKRLAVHVEDHPVTYGSFEGIIPAGQYGGGTVLVWDTGRWESLDKDPKAAYKKGSMKFIIKGKKLKGEWHLFALKNDPKNWLLIKAKDKFASTTIDITEKYPLSAKSGKSMDEIASKVTKIKKKPEITIAPELCTLVDKIPNGPEWLHEIKLDGYRLIIMIKNKKTSLITRGKQDWTHKFQSIVKALKWLKLDNAILDGEVVILDKNYRSDFQLLQNAIRDGSEEFVLYLFDVMYLKNRSLVNLPLLQRKEILKNLLLKSPDNYSLRYHDHIIGNGEKVFKKSCELSLEGIVSKNIHSHYIPKRTHDWLKIKCIQRQEFIIGGFTLPKNSRQCFGAILIGVYKGDRFIYCGRVGTGFDDQTLNELFGLLKKHRISENPFDNKVPEGKQARWVKPSIVIEVEFTEWTQDGRLRHPSFKGIRNDKSPKKIKRELAMNEIKLTHPEKILYPTKKITKLDIANYCSEIQDWILPYITNRPLSLLRCPDGVNSQVTKCFFQKHIASPSPKSLYATNNDHIYIKNLDGLLGLTQLGVLEIHPWGSTIKKLEKPDIIIFDLDPAPEVKWKKVVEAAFKVKAELEKIKLTSFVKSTGGKGLHVVIPIQPNYDWEAVKHFSKVFSEYMVMQNPKEYTSVMSKAKRTGKIFIDYLRNQRGATAIAPYSTRANDNATVAAPLHWDELTGNIKDTLFTIQTMLKRLQSLDDPWKDFFKIKQSIDLKK